MVHLLQAQAAVALQAQVDHTQVDLIRVGLTQADHTLQLMLNVEETE